MKNDTDEFCQCESMHDDSFEGWSDFHKFVNELSNNSKFQKVPIIKPLVGVAGLVENWYQCTSCDQVWRLVEPDPPFVGIWSVVKDV